MGAREKVAALYRYAAWKEAQVVKLQGKGRGVVADRDMKPGELVEEAPVIVLRHGEVRENDGSTLDNFVFKWSKGRSAVALGNGSLYNHSDDPNLRVDRDFDREAVRFYAARAVQKGEELTFRYGDADQEVVFDGKGGYHYGSVKKAELAEDGEHELDGHLSFQGLSIAVENRKGSVRSGKRPDGSEWHTKMRAPYGYIEAPTKAKDGESIDCYVGPKKDAPIAYVVHQHKPDGTGHDEDKVMLGTGSEQEAKRLYLQHYDDPKFLGPISAVPMDRLKTLLETKQHLHKIAFDESDADRVLKVTKPLKLRHPSIVEGGYSATDAPRVTTGQADRFMDRHVHADLSDPNAVMARQQMLEDMPIGNTYKHDPRTLRRIEAPVRGDSVSHLRELVRGAPAEGLVIPPGMATAANINLAPAQRKMMNAITEGHELDELHYMSRPGPSEYEYIKDQHHAHPGVLLREHNRVTTMPASFEPVRTMKKLIREDEGHIFSPYGVQLGTSNRLSRHAIRHISEDMAKGQVQRVFNKNLYHNKVLSDAIARVAKTAASIATPYAPQSLLIKGKAPRIPCPAVRMPPGTPKV